MRLLPSVLSATLVSGSLWLWDLLRLSSYSFAGVTDQAAADRVLSVTGGAIKVMELELLVVHLVLGGVFGLLCGLTWQTFAARWSRARRAAATAALTFVAFTLALFGMVGTYPQLFADRWWLAGGGLATLQRLITHSIGPRFFDVCLLALLLALVVAPVVRARRTLSSAKKGAARTYAVAALFVLLSAGALRTGLGAASPERKAARNLLILAADSLRSDRLEAPEVMPNMAARLDQGSLFRRAITPIARTYPAWVSTLTGTEPRRNGVRHMFPTKQARRDVGPTLFTTLRDRGYFTFATSDFAGDIFPGFEGGFEVLDTPHLNVDTLATSTALSGHTWSLPLLRLRVFRSLFPFWKNLPSLAQPEWLAEDARRHIQQAGDRPFAGLVFFSTAHFPYVAPYPHYERGSGGYLGPYLYHVPPVLPIKQPGPEDVEQIRARYDGALSAIDIALEGLFDHLDESGLTRNTLVIVTGDHGEELYELEGIAGHGDTIRHLRSQSVPIFLTGPDVARDERSDEQVRLYDIPATALQLLTPDGPRSFGDGHTLMDSDHERPICVETGIWFWPGRPPGLKGQRLDYPGISQLLDMDVGSREMVLRVEMENLVESAKERGLILGNRLWREQLTPDGAQTEAVKLKGLQPDTKDEDLRAWFQSRCVDGDPHLFRLYNAVVFDRSEAVVFDRSEE